jgi:hypothetical protein
MDKLRKNSTIKIASVLDKSTFFNDVDETITDIPAINIALSGSIDGGMKSGILTIAGPSRHFKTMYGLIIAAAYLKKHKDAILFFMDSEFGSPKEYFSAVGINTSRVLHVPVKNLEELKFEMMQQLTTITRGEKVFFMIDSIGNLASLKEQDDAIDGKSVGDMSRAKYLKSFYRIITPYLRILDIPLVQIGHIYMTQEIYSKAVLSGGCLLAGTELIMSDGTNKNIENISVGDLVHTMAGPKLVTHTWNPDTLENGTPNCYEIEFEDGYKVICSDTHPFLVEDKWVCAKDLTEDMDVTTV